MEKNDCKSWGLLLLRAVAGIIFLYHGLPKATQWSAAMSAFAGMGFPGFLGPIVGIVEVVAAVLVLLGVWHAWANYALAAIVAVAILAVQGPGAVEAGVLLTAGLERDLLLLSGTLLLAWSGPGKFTVPQ